MLVFGNERTIHQGETWNLDVVLSQSSIEYVPFVVSSQRVNPMWTITVASTKFEKNERFVATWWLDMLELPKFYQTVISDLGELLPTQPVSKPVLDSPMYALYRYTLSNEIYDQALGHKPYHYVYFDELGESHTDYECHIIMQFTSSETRLWEAQSYLYQITLVDTLPMGDVVNEAHDNYPDLQWMDWVQTDDPNWDKPVQGELETNEAYEVRLNQSWIEFRNLWINDNINVLFPFIKARIPDWFQADIDVDSPIGMVDNPQVILTPTKLQVTSNLRKVI